MLCFKSNGRGEGDKRMNWKSRRSTAQPCSILKGEGEFNQGLRPVALHAHISLARMEKQRLGLRTISHSFSPCFPCFPCFLFCLQRIHAIPFPHGFRLLGSLFFRWLVAWLELSGRVGTLSFHETTWIAFALADDMRHSSALIPNVSQPLGVFLQSEFTSLADHGAWTYSDTFCQLFVERCGEVPAQIVEH